MTSQNSRTRVFICYSHKDTQWRERLQVHLRPLEREGRVDLWADTQIKSGQKWRDEIDAALQRSTVAVMLVSADFYASDFIAQIELSTLLAREQENGLVVLALHVSPSRFSRDVTLNKFQSVNEPDQPIDLLRKSDQEELFDKLVQRIESIIGQSQSCAPAINTQRATVTTSKAGGATTVWSDAYPKLPCFFRSISSHETQLQPAAALEILRLMRTRPVLVSAYDICNDAQKEKMIEEMRRSRTEGSFILMDSGNYESTRRKDDKWTLKKFYKSLEIAPFDFAFSYDQPNQSKSAKSLANLIVSEVKRDRKATGRSEILPIIHAPGNPTKGYRIELVPEAIRLIAEQLRPPMIAIPERELGNGLWERIKTVQNIRKELGYLTWHQPIHILGAGNLVTVAALAAAGADCFDGLEWCRTAADHETGFLHHYQHYDMFVGQTVNSANPYAAASSKSSGITYGAKVAIHNLDFIDKWMGKIHASMASSSMGAFLLEVFKPFPGRAVEDLIRAMPDVIGG